MCLAVRCQAVCSCALAGQLSVLSAYLCPMLCRFSTSWADSRRRSREAAAASGEGHKEMDRSACFQAENLDIGCRKRMDYDITFHAQACSLGHRQSEEPACNTVWH